MKRTIILLLMLLASNIVVYAQAGKEKTPGLIKSKNFTFYATSALPQNSAEIAGVLNNPAGRSSNISLSPDIYQVSLRGDSLTAFLPYYGRSYNASADLNNGGIKFTSKDFSYSALEQRKGGWTITMNTKDINKGNERLTLSVSTSGYATLNVTGLNRSNISFSGYIDEPPVNK